MTDHIQTTGLRWLIAFSQWIEDRRWAANMVCARRDRRRLKASQKLVFDNVLRPRCAPGLWIAEVWPYPDAIYEITARDVGRAMIAARCFEGALNPRVAAEAFMREHGL